MKLVGFFVCLLSIHVATAVGGLLLKHLTEPKPGGIIDTIRNPKIPRPHFQLGSHLSLGIGSFGLNFGFNKQYGPPGVNLPPKETIPGFPDGKPYVPGYPDGNPYVPGEKPNGPNGNPYVPGVKPGYPDGNPYVPGVRPDGPNGNPYVPGVKPGYPDGNPYVPGVKPEIPGVTWEEEKKEKIPKYPRPNSGEDEHDYSKPGPYEDDKVDYPKPGSYEEGKDYPKREDLRPDWEDIGEKFPNKDPKSENFMDGDLIADGLIQPRLNKNRSKRFIESHVYHVPLLFRSNGKPYQVKVQSNFNSLMKESFEA